MEQALHSFYGAGAYWELHSCNLARIALDFANILQAILTPILIFLLPGPGSILRAKSAPSSVHRPSPRLPTSAIAQAHPAAPETLSARTSCIARVFSIFLLIVSLWVFLSGYVSVKYWFIDHPEMQPRPKPAALPMAIVYIVSGLLGMGWGVRLLRVRVAWRSLRFMAAGWLVAGAVAIAWWYGLGGYAKLHGLCTDLFDLGRAVSPDNVDMLSDCAHYYIFMSVFAALWTGIAAGALRLQSARAADGSLTDPLGRYQSFYWAGLLAWVVQYRVSGYLALFPMIPFRRAAGQQWAGGSLLQFFFVTASSLWAILLIRRLWKLKTRDRQIVLWTAFAGSLIVYLLTACVSVWAWYMAAGAFTPLVTLNICGLAWALYLSKWYGRAQQQLQPA